LLIAWLPVLILFFGADLKEVAQELPWSRMKNRAWESLLVAGGATLLALCLGSLLALGLSRLRIPGRKLWLLCAFLPLFIPSYVTAIAAVHMFGAQGWITRHVIAPGVEYPLGPVAPSFSGIEDSTALPPRPSFTPEDEAVLRSAPIYSRTGVIGILVFCYLPLVLLGGWAFLGMEDRAGEDWARLHVGVLKTLLFVALPRAAPGVLLGAGCVFLFSLAEFGVPEALRTYPVLAVEVYTQMGVYYSPAGGAAAALLLVAMGLPLGAMAAWVIRRRWNEFASDATSDANESVAPSLMAQRFSARWISTAVILAIGVIPLLLTVATLLSSSLERGSLTAWRVTWQTGRDELGVSLGLGLLCAGFCLALGRLMAASPIARRNHSRADSAPIPWSRLVLGGLIFLPLTLPGPVVATGWNLILNPLAGAGRLPDAGWIARLLGGLANALLEGPGALMLAWIGRWTPIAFGLFWWSLRQIPAEWREAADLEGVRGLVRWWVVERPVIFRAAAAGGLFIAALSLGEVGAAILLLPPGMTTVGVRLLTLMHYAPTSTVSVLAVLNLLLGLGGALIALSVWRVGKRLRFS
jgi:iron(III) transport system permease protein